MNKYGVFWLSNGQHAVGLNVPVGEGQMHLNTICLIPISGDKERDKRDAQKIANVLSADSKTEANAIEACAKKAEGYQQRIFDNGRTAEFSDVYDAYASGWQNCAYTIAVAIRDMKHDSIFDRPGVTATLTLDHRDPIDALLAGISGYTDSGIVATQAGVLRKFADELGSNRAEIAELKNKLAVYEDPDFLTNRLASGFDAFWNAAVGEVQNNQHTTQETMHTIGAIAVGFSAVSEQLRKAPVKAAPEPTQLTTQEIQMLMSIRDRTNCVIEKAGDDLDIIFHLSDLGYAAMEQLPQGVNGHITRLGRKALDEFLKTRA